MKNLIFAVFLFVGHSVINAAPVAISLSQSAKTIEIYDYLEVTITINNPDVINPFIDVLITGEFINESSPPIVVNGFCDSDDGSIYRIRFMPSQPGRYTGSILYQQENFTSTHQISFTAKKSNRKGPVRVDPEHPFHFVWEGTDEHYFCNSTTAYALIGWQDENVIHEIIERFDRLKVNRIRAAIFPPRVNSGNAWLEPTVTNNSQFSFLANPWPALNPDSVNNPEFDISRFNINHWRKFENMVNNARERNIIISAIFYVDGAKKGSYPFRNNPGGEDEKRYYRYAAARLSSFSNIMWDVTNEYNLFLNEEWAEDIGAFLKKCDPYDHITSIHHSGKEFNFRNSSWVDFASYQQWDENGGYQFMINNRNIQTDTGRPMPQINEEYGYEDHYPRWGGNRKWPARTADTRRRLAWEISMAGAYQTTGERANLPGYGGWLNGRGNEEMVMLKGYIHIRDFFERIPWWRLIPHPELVGSSALCLAEIGKQYVIYFPEGGITKIDLIDGKYHANWYNPRNGKYNKKMKITGGESISITPPDSLDWVYYIKMVKKK